MKKLTMVLLLVAGSLCGCADLPPRYDEAHDSILFPHEVRPAKEHDASVEDVWERRQVPFAWEGHYPEKYDPLQADIIAERIMPDPKDYMLSWLHNGLLFVRGAYPVGKNGKLIRATSGPCMHREYLYCSKAGDLMVVCTLAGFSAMMREELENTQSTESFLKLGFAEIFNEMLGYRNSDVINQELLKYRASGPGAGFPENVSQAQRKHSTEVLKKYLYPGPTIENGKWRTVFYVSLCDGSVEKWELNGQVQPFSVDHLTKTVVEKSGTVVQYLRWVDLNKTLLNNDRQEPPMPESATGREVRATGDFGRRSAPSLPFLRDHRKYPCESVCIRGQTNHHHKNLPNRLTKT